jgi:hypothetical protein
MNEDEELTSKELAKYTDPIYMLYEDITTTAILELMGVTVYVLYEEPGKVIVEVTGLPANIDRQRIITKVMDPPPIDDVEFRFVDSPL